MISKDRFREAMEIVKKYTAQLTPIKGNPKHPTEIGCKVKLSKWGLEMQGKRKAKIKGVVIDYLPWIMNPGIDGIVTVKWIGLNKPDDMHISQIKNISSYNQLK